MPRRNREERRPRHRHWFPIGGFILLVIGLVWLLNELNVFRINIPWVPLVVIVIGIGIIFNHYYRRRF